jgi:hypothetical protein
MGNIYDSSVSEVFFDGEVVRGLRRGELEDTPCEKCNIYV